MKILFVSALCLVSFSALARGPVDDFHKALLENVEKDIKQDEDRFRKTNAARGPASVENKETIFYEEQKIDKTIRQIGHKKW